MPHGGFLSNYRSLFPYLSRYRASYFWGFLCLIIVDAAQIAIPQFIKRAIDLISSGVFEWNEIIFLCLWMIIIMALISLGRFLWRYFIHGSSRRIETEMRDKLFGHLQTLSWDFYQKNKIGDLMARSTKDLDAVRMAIGMGLVAMVDFVVMASAILIIMFVQDARSALVSIIPLPIITVLILVFGKSVGRRFQTAHENYSKMSDTVQESFSGLRVIKSFVKEWWFIKKFAADNDDYRIANMELARLFGFFFPLVTFLSSFTILLMLVIGGIRVVNGLMTAGSLVAMFRYLSMLIWPLMGAGFMVNMIQRGAVSLGRINEVLNTVPSIRDENIENVICDNGIDKNDNTIIINNLNFSYNNNEQVLQNINITVKTGEWLGIMGKTGSGKSTLIKTLTRMVDPSPGSVMVFGRDVRKLPLAELRGLFAVGPQDSYLFSDSIKNNIAYGLNVIDSDLLQKVISMAALGRDIAGFANGEGALIGERGLTLSGGQKQRVAIARALVMDSEILILDDSLSAVDAETERKFLDCLLEERKNRTTGSPRTTIIISHRVSTLRYADKVLVLDDGKQAEYGAPAELANADGFYSRMARLQQLELAPPGEAVNG